MSKLDLKSLPEQLTMIGGKVNRFKLPVFLVFVACIYGFVISRVNSLSNVQPDPNAISTQVSPITSTHIDPTTVKQLESLSDNSVNVQALFQQARNNPFQD